MKIFTRLLIISILFSQSAWAMLDVEPDLLEKQMYSQSTEHNDIHGDADHCGHASSHLVAIISKDTLNLSTQSKTYSVHMQKSASSIQYQPPVPPPNV